MKKKISSVLVALLIFTLLPSLVLAGNATKVYFDNQLVKFSVNPIAEKGTTLVQFKPIFEKYGLNIQWDSSTQKITGSNKDIKIVLKVGSKVAFVNNKETNLPVAVKTVNGNTLIPLRFVSDAMGSKIRSEYGDIYIDSKGNKPVTKGLGSVKGVITWQYNDYIGTKPDVNARIALIPRNPAKKIDNNFFGLLVSQTASDQGKDGIYTTKADGYGNYGIDNVPAGDYYILVISENTKSDLTVKEWDEETIDGLFTAETAKSLKLNMKLNKYSIKSIKVTKNNTITHSHDFGNTYY